MICDNLPKLTKDSVETTVFKIIVNDLNNPKLSDSEKITIIDWYIGNFDYKKEIIKSALKRIKIKKQAEMISTKEEYDILAKEYIWIAYKNEKIKYLNYYMELVNPSEKVQRKYAWEFSSYEIFNLFYDIEGRKERKVIYNFLEGYINWIVKEKKFNIKNKLARLDKDKLIKI